jgi:hypothetical protein
VTTAASPNLIDIKTLAGMLADRIDGLVGELLPAGLREGAEWRIGSLAAEMPGRSMAVHLGGSKAGVWSDFASSDSGGALDLVAQVLFRGDKSRAVKWSRTWLGLDGADPASFAKHRRHAERRRDQARHEDERRHGWATRTFLAAQPALADTPAAHYLVERGIDLAELGRQPSALRFHPTLWNDESQRHWPALVAAICNSDGRMVAIHRTWLVRDGAGKAPLRNPKMTLGRYAGGIIRLWRGASGKPLKHAPDGGAIILSEGIEDGLSCAIAAPEYRVAAAVSLANMASILLPPAIGTVIIAAQNDTPGSPAARALDRAIAAFQRQGRGVKVAKPPAGVKDMNDLLHAAGSAA